MALTRRSLLASGIVLLAGCSSDTGSVGNTPTERPLETPTATTAGPTPTSTPGGPLSVSFVGYAVQRSGFYPRHPDFEIVWAPPDRQLLFVMVAVDGGMPTDLSFEDFSLRVDGRTIEEADGVEGQDGDTYYPRPDECACDGQYETYATFPLQAPLSADTAVVRWSGPEDRAWELPADALTALAAPTTAWELISFDAPDTVGSNESFTVAFEAENAGDASGVFRGVLNQTGPMYGVSARWKLRVEAGETIRKEQTIGILQEIDSDVDEVNLALRTVGGDVDHTVQVN